MSRKVQHLRFSHLCCWRFRSLATSHIVSTGN